MDEIFVELNLSTIRLESNDKGFLSYTKNHFSPVLRAANHKPIIEVNYFLGKEVENEKLLVAKYKKVGRGIYLGENQILWNSIPMFPGLSMRFSFIDEQMIVYAHYTPLKRLKLELKIV